MYFSKVEGFCSWIPIPARHYEFVVELKALLHSWKPLPIGSFLNDSTKSIQKLFNVVKHASIMVARNITA